MWIVGQALPPALPPANRRPHCGASTRTCRVGTPADAWRTPQPAAVFHSNLCAATGPSNTRACRVDTPVNQGGYLAPAGAFTPIFAPHSTSQRQPHRFSNRKCRYERPATITGVVVGCWTPASSSTVTATALVAATSTAPRCTCMAVPSDCDWKRPAGTGLPPRYNPHLVALAGRGGRQVGRDQQHTPRRVHEDPALGGRGAVGAERNSSRCRDR